MASYPEPKKAAAPSASDGQGVRPAVLIPLLVLGLGCVVACVVFWPKGRVSDRAPGAEAPARPESQNAASSAPSVSANESLPVQVTNTMVAAAGKATLPPVRPAPAPITPRVEPSPYTRQLVNSLVSLEQTGVPRTAEQVAAWKQNLQQLVQQGAAALPAIREFLERNVDFTFGNDGAKALGYDSARAAMYDALVQIGGPEAAGLLLDTLRNTASPQDIAQLARSLEQMAPGQYRAQLLDAARQALSMPMDGQVNPVDVAPLFDVLTKYGGPNALTELGESGTHWKYYLAIAMGQLPDGAGVPALTQMLQEPGGGAIRNIPALEMLTQLAAQNPDAKAALLQQVRAGNVAPNTWAYLLAALEGDQVHFQDPTAGGASGLAGINDVRTFHIASGNQNFYTAPPPGGMSAEQINQQMALIDELLAATPNPTAQQILQNAKDVLQRRSGQSSTTGKP